ncbi:CapA family protein [Fulvivirga maritima]|uniref:CapA family protein n=1 Tax=Fulvivirga maritima TaxID=2904247 RepID=UPI001F3DBB77|nr:CapA family protein [Fulvivirga maritima]UII26041.1 CapA family protein [Fulvivirga maritima]
MKAKLHPVLSFLLVVFFLSACKVAQKSSSTQSQAPAIDSTAIAVQDTTILEPDTVAVVEGQDSVELQAHRLLKDTVSIIGVGDIMMGTNFPETWYLPPNEGKDLLKEVNPILQNADVTFGNLEGVILDEGGNPKYCKDPKVCYIFRSPEYLAQNLVTAGFDVMSTANNHAGDFGDPGRKNTMRVLDSLNIHHAGQTVRPYSTFMLDGMKYGFAAFSPNTGTMSINNVAAAQKIVAHLDSISDIVIVSFHGGAEGSKYQHVTRKNEYFYGENRGNVYLFAHEMINAGADVIFGHGPHVTRAVEVYNDRFIIYSLGNFCTYARFNLRGDNGLAPIVKVFTDSEGKFLKAQVTPVIQKAPGGPSIDKQKRIITKLQELTAEDFPESQIKIDDSGLINYIKN